MRNRTVLAGTVVRTLCAFIPLCLSIAVQAQILSEGGLVEALQGGGYVLVMRHANSPAEPPDSTVVNPDNVTRERQLDAEGRRTAAAMGEALRRLQISISEVLSSPSYRTLETARYLGFSAVETREYLGNQGMQVSGETVGESIREQLESSSGQGNRLLITHSPNVAAAFPELTPTIAQGEVLVFQIGSSMVTPVARIEIGDWSRF